MWSALIKSTFDETLKIQTINFPNIKDFNTRMKMFQKKTSNYFLNYLGLDWFF